MINNRFTALFLTIIFSWMSSYAQETQKINNLEKFHCLLGEWVGGGGNSTTGQGTGGSKFYLDLDNQIIVRENTANYPATAGRPAFTHADKMIIYPYGLSTKAIYFDNEGHVINYDVSMSDDLCTITFLSDMVPDAPRFRLSYIIQSHEQQSLKFEMAQPGTPEVFQLYLTSELRRK
jgi:hypothetical protein